MSSQTILVVEDDEGIRTKLAELLGREYQVQSCSTLAEARIVLSSRPLDLILLDMKLPDGEGTKFYLEIRDGGSNANTPVIFLTGRGEPEDKVMAFALGADDYIVKPFEIRELRARIKARIQKSASRKESDAQLTRGDLRIDLLLRRVFISGASEREVELTPTTFKLLVHFARHEDHVLSREQLIAAVWGSGVHLYDRTVDSHVSKLRKALEGSSHGVIPVHGVGYRFSRLALSEKKSA